MPGCCGTTLHPGGEGSPAGRAPGHREGAHRAGPCGLHAVCRGGGARGPCAEAGHCARSAGLDERAPLLPESTAATAGLPGGGSGLPWSSLTRGPAPRGSPSAGHSSALPGLSRRTFTRDPRRLRARGLHGLLLGQGARGGRVRRHREVRQARISEGQDRLAGRRGRKAEGGQDPGRWETEWSAGSGPTSWQPGGSRGSWRRRVCPAVVPAPPDATTRSLPRMTRSNPAPALPEFR